MRVSHQQSEQLLSAAETKQTEHYSQLQCLFMARHLSEYSNHFLVCIVLRLTGLHNSLCSKDKEPGDKPQ